MNLEEIKKRKLAELQARITEKDSEEFQELQKLQEIKQQLVMIEQVVKEKMTKEALQRYGNIKIAHPEKATQLLIVLYNIISRGTTKIDDNLVKEILIKLNEKRETRIIRK